VVEIRLMVAESQFYMHWSVKIVEREMAELYAHGDDAQSPAAWLIDPFIKTNIAKLMQAFDIKLID